ncbi:hypothetical protein FTX61_18045 [Nitriliruptoraceae bacterium ZYF776]|nr:hypothetical protein [Profundirhabdus halotolerans]
MRRRVLLTGLLAVGLAACGGPDLSDVPPDAPPAAGADDGSSDDGPLDDGALDDGADDGADDGGAVGETDLLAEFGAPAELATSHALNSGIGYSVPGGFESDTFAMTDGVLQVRHEDGLQEAVAVLDVDQREGSEWGDLDYDAATARASTLGDTGARLEGDVDVAGASRARGFVYDLPEVAGEQVLVLAEAPSGLALFIYLGAEGSFDPATAALFLESATLDPDLP